MKYCRNCGSQIHDKAVICVNCGCAVESTQTMNNGGMPFATATDPFVSPKSGLVTLLLAIFLGTLGIHRFYVGKTGTGLIQLFTCGLCFVWTFIDIIQIAVGNFTDEQGRVVKL